MKRWLFRAHPKKYFLPYMICICCYLYYSVSTAMFILVNEMKIPIIETLMYGEGDTFDATNKKGIKIRCSPRSNLLVKVGDKIDYITPHYISNSDTIISNMTNIEKDMYGYRVWFDGEQIYVKNVELYFDYDYKSAKKYMKLFGYKYSLPKEDQFGNLTSQTETIDHHLYGLIQCDKGLIVSKRVNGRMFSE